MVDAPETNLNQPEPTNYLVGSLYLMYQELQESGFWLVKQAWGDSDSVSCLRSLCGFARHSLVGIDEPLWVHSEELMSLCGSLETSIGSLGGLYNWAGGRQHSPCCKSCNGTAQAFLQTELNSTGLFSCLFCLHFWFPGSDDITTYNH